MDNKEKKADAKIKISSDNKFLKWLDNYWYHYKWPTIGVIFLLVVVIVCTVQMFQKEEKDIYIIYAGPAVSAEEVLALSESGKKGSIGLPSDFASSFESIIEGILPRDFNDDGEKLASVSVYTVYSAEQIKDITAIKDKDGKPFYNIDSSYNTNQHKTYSSDMTTGGASICFLDPWLYREFSENNPKHLCPLSEIFGDDIPEGAVGEYGIRLGSTAIYKEYKVLQEMPADTVICLENALLTEKMSKNSKEKFEFEKDTFAAIVNYKPKTENTAKASPIAALPCSLYSEKKYLGEAVCR